MPPDSAKIVNQLPLTWLHEGLKRRLLHLEHSFRFTRANSHYSDVLLHKEDWAASQETVLQNTPPGGSQEWLVVAGESSHLELPSSTMPYLSKVAERVKRDDTSTHRGHTPKGITKGMHVFHASRPRRLGHPSSGAPSQGRRHTVAAQTSSGPQQPFGVYVLPQSCLLCGRQAEAPTHMQVGRS